MKPRTNGVSRKIRLVRDRCGQKRILQGSAKPEKRGPPKIARKMALAIKIEGLLSSGKLESEAELARTVNLDRGVISRLLMLRLLAPDLQEAVLMDPRYEGITMKTLLAIIRESVCWPEQRRQLNALVDADRLQDAPPISGNT